MDEGINVLRSAGRSPNLSPGLRDVGVISALELREIRNKTIQGKKTDAIMISNNEL